MPNPLPAESGAGLPDSEFAFDLARRAGSGDAAATEEFLAYVWPTLIRAVAGVMGSSHPDVHDASQQAMIAVVRALPAFRGECNPVGYAARIGLHTALRVRRKDKRALQHAETFTRYSEEPEVSLSPEEDVLAARRRELLRNLLTDLPAEQAEALTLRVVMGWTLEEVARATGAPLNTVRSRVRLAKEALRKRIESAPEFGELTVTR